MKNLCALVMALFSCVCYGQSSGEPPRRPEHIPLEEVRTQSGIDPTRLLSKIGFSTWYFDKEASNAQINNRISTTFVVNEWAFNLRLDLVSLNTVPGREGFVTGAGNLKMNILNAFYSDDRHAMAASVDLAFPTAAPSIAAATGLNAYFYLTPAFSYAYTINPGLMVALQPQYSFAVAKGNAAYPAMSLLTVRTFIAKFYDSGLFLVFEPRPMYDFTRKSFDLIISPIVGRTLGGGYTLTLLAEIPVKKEMLHNTGALFLLGIKRTF